MENLRAVKFSIVKVDTGFCQVTFKCKNAENQTIFYCLQDNGKREGIRLLRATPAPWFEPEYTVDIESLKKVIAPAFEIPSGDSELEEKCRQWIESNGVK